MYREVRGVGQCTLVGRPGPGGSWTVLRSILRRRLLIAACQTYVTSEDLRRENEDPELPLQGPGTHGKTQPLTERGYGRLFAG